MTRVELHCKSLWVDGDDEQEGMSWCRGELRLEKAAAVLKEGWVAHKAASAVEYPGPAYRNEPNERSTRLVPQCNPYNLRKVRICISTTLQR